MEAPGKFQVQQSLKKFVNFSHRNSEVNALFLHTDNNKHPVNLTSPYAHFHSLFLRNGRAAAAQALTVTSWLALLEGEASGPLTFCAGLAALLPNP